MQIRIHNAALQRGLTPNEAKVYAYLIACSNRLNNAVVRMETIRAACGIGSRSTVCTAIQGLCSKGLIVKYNRRNHEGDFIANGYTITQLRGGWFTLDTRSMQVFQLDKSSFLVYLFFLQCKRHQSRKVFPSLAKIAAALRTCKNTVIKAIKDLIRLEFIRKSRPSHKGRLNVYLLLGAAVEALITKPTQHSVLISPILAGLIRFVKCICRFVAAFLLGKKPAPARPPVFLRSGSAFFGQQCPD